MAKNMNEALMAVLKDRFEGHMERHEGQSWESVKARLLAQPEKLHSLDAMEKSGGEPDVLGSDPKTGEFIFIDCSAESPVGRRSLCYDKEAFDSRKSAKPEASALERARAMGLELLDEDTYRALQKTGNYDLKTSSWLKTPADMRKLGGAIFGDRRYGRVFIYHNGAESYYAVRGFRGVLRV